MSDFKSVVHLIFWDSICRNGGIQVKCV